ncbi:hypothetical protein SASPL_146594 [Salvia splendens]|uniref:Phytocyanin domain-containing protein n=1 Tax=Salvia splendens TaxID=180675 RepID=A0A8X8WCE9_SALSN|nr:hypothetical protein SASPL_146594 [Salvia splendens]
MAAALLAFVAAVALAGAGVSAETHHVVGGWGPDFNATAWLVGRFFTVGDKLRTVRVRWRRRRDDGGGARRRVRDLQRDEPDPILTDPVSHVALEEEGVRYFTSADPENCRKGLKLPVTINRAHEHEHDPSPPYDPWKPDEPDVPSPPYEPWEPDVPSPPHKVPPPPTPTPSPSPAAALLDAGLCLCLAAAFWIFI